MEIILKELGTQNIHKDNDSSKEIVRTRRIATLTVTKEDGTTEDITRGIPDAFDGSLQDYLKALADGIRAEYAPKEVTPIEADEVEPGLVL